MVKPQLATLLRLAPALALCACAIPKAIVVELPKKAQTDSSTASPDLANANLPVMPDDGLRLPDMEAMPGDSDFRATAPNLPKSGSEANAVSARPPTDPPSRPKPKDKKSEPE